jgi:hypothetical protein
MPKNTSNRTNATNCNDILKFLEVGSSGRVDELTTDARLVLELLVLIVDIRYRHKYKRGEDET